MVPKGETPPHWAKALPGPDKQFRATVGFLPDEYAQLAAVTEFLGVYNAEVLREAIRAYAIKMAEGT